MSRWPGMPYINQYDAGARLRLPLRFGYRGGNGAGPAALLMAMLRSGGPRNLPALTTVYDRTMQRPRSAVRPNQPNAFVGSKAVALLRSLGWRSARLRSLGKHSRWARGPPEAPPGISPRFRIARRTAAWTVPAETARGSSSWRTSWLGVTIVLASVAHAVTLLRFLANQDGL